MTLRPWMALALLGTAGCAMVKKYSVEPSLPNGESLANQALVEQAVVVAIPGLDIRVEGCSQEIAYWIGPPLIPPIIPLPNDKWDHPPDLTVYLTFYSYSGGHAFAWREARMHEEGAQPVAPARGSNLDRLLRASGRAEPKAEPESLPDEVLIIGWTHIAITFPIRLPLEGRVVLYLDGLTRDGRPVELPVLEFGSRYRLYGPSFS
jgi:hypothetical protein